MLPYKVRQLKALIEVEGLVTTALAKLNRYGGGYPGDLRDLKDLVRIKLKLEQVQRRISAGRKLEWGRYERSSTRTTK